MTKNNPGYAKHPREHSENAKRGMRHGFPGGPAHSHRQEIVFSHDDPLGKDELARLMKRINDSPQNEHGMVQDEDAKALIDKAWNSPGENGWKLTEELNQKGLAFLRSHKGALGPREEVVLENHPEIRLIGVYQDKRPGERGHFYPYYRVRSAEHHRGSDGQRTYFDTFDYAYHGGKLHILG